MIGILHCETKTEMVVGWFEEELWVVRGSCGTVLVRRESGLWIHHNRVDCEATCGSLCWIDYEVLECDTCAPLPFDVLKLHYVHNGEFFKEW